jgi:hypothetical protein
LFLVLLCASLYGTIIALLGAKAARNDEDARAGFTEETCIVTAAESPRCGCYSIEVVHSLYAPQEHAVRVQNRYPDKRLCTWVGPCGDSPPADLVALRVNDVLGCYASPGFFHVYITKGDPYVCNRCTALCIFGLLGSLCFLVAMVLYACKAHGEAYPYPGYVPPQPPVAAVAPAQDPLPPMVVEVVI